ncbi:flagellar hook-length control protein FliK [Chromatium okenii]|nr:flagellar hook-length control protein FliK [Chromatium okenii]
MPSMLMWTAESQHLPMTEVTRSAAHQARLKRTHSELLIHDIDGMIKHVVTQQLHSLSSDSAQPRWLLELPFRIPSGALLMLDVEIERERRGTRPEDERWNMRLKLNLPRIGPLSINLSLRMERLDAGLQAGTEAGAALIRSHLETLRQQLAEQHLDIASLYAGYRPQSNSTAPSCAPTAPMIQERG